MQLSVAAARFDAGERIWQQPLEDSYFEKHVKSQIADLKNYPGEGETLHSQ